MMIREDAELHRAQRAFRSVLDAFARPGTVQSIELAPGNPARPAALDAALEAATRLFVDQAVTFCVADSETDATTAYLTSETHARRAPLRDADFVVVPARADAQTAREAVAEACRGTLTSPEKGATVLMGCARLAEVPEDGQVAEPAVHVVALRGPGVERENRFAVDRADWLRARDARGDEFPCGIEIVLVDPDGRVLDVKQSAQGGATREQMFHVKHSEAAPGEAVETGASVAGGASSASAEDRAFSVSAASAVGCASAAKEVR